MLRIDHGGEFTARTFMEYCTEQGIQRHLTTPYMPQQNGMVERTNQTIMGMARSMMKEKSLPGWFWGEAANAAVFILNQAPTQSVNGKTPFEVWHGRKPPCTSCVLLGVLHMSRTAASTSPSSTIGACPWCSSGTSRDRRRIAPATHRVHISHNAVFKE
jgi:hypothetical protein